MKKTNCFKKLTTLTAVACVCLGAFFSPDTALSAQAAPMAEEEIAPCADDIRWVYQTINGHVYRRLYNYTTRSWETSSWELVA